MAVQRDKIIASAEKLVAKGKIEPAIKEYERLLDDNPNDVNTLNRIGDLWVRINRNDEAVKVFGRIADHYARDGFFLKAIAIYKKINKLDPSKLDVYGKLADLYAKQGLAMEAKSQYQVLADYYLKHGDPGNALGVYRKIAELDPNSINVHVKLADLYSQNNQTAEALKEYDRVGRMLIKRGMLEEAVQVFKKALKIDAKNIELIESLVTALLENKDFNNAAQILETALASNPGNSKLVSLSAKANLARGDIAAARAALEEGFANNPNDSSIREALAEVHLRSDAPDKALEVLGPVIDAATARGDRAGLEMIQRVLRVDSSHTGSLERLVRFYVKINEETNILSSMNTLAEAHMSKRNYEAAATVLSDLIRREPENAQHREKLSFVQQKTGGVSDSPAQPATPVTSYSQSTPQPDSEFAIDFDDSPALELDMTMDDSMPSTSSSTASPMPSMSVVEPLPEMLPDPEDDDLDFITEHMTEAEVFAKYGLAEKAIEHLRNVLERVPNHLPAHERLFRLYLDEGMTEQVRPVAETYIALLRERGDLGAVDMIELELATKGVSGGVVSAPEPLPTPAPPPPAARKAAPPPPPVISEPEPVIEDLPADFTSDMLETEVEIEIEEDEPILQPLPEETISFGEDLDSSMLESDLSEPLPSIDDAMPTFEEDSLGELSLDDTATEISIDDSPIEAAAEPMLEEIEMPPPEPMAPAAEELGEVDFYIEQHLLDEAREKLDALQFRFPADPEVLERADRLAAAQAAALAPVASAVPAETLETDLLSSLLDDEDEESTFGGPRAEVITPPSTPPPVVSAAVEESLFADEDDFFDLAAELEEELEDGSDTMISLSEEEQSLEEIFREFKKGVEQQLDSEDYDTHYNLGIAYKEMGLTDEAIGEFQLASKDPKRAIECCSMLGLCFLEKGMPQLAIKWYRKGLEVPEIGEDEHLGLLYDLGAAHVETGDTDAAHKAFIEIYGIKSNYRDVVSRIKQLENA